MVLWTSRKLKSKGPRESHETTARPLLQSSLLCLWPGHLSVAAALTALCSQACLAKTCFILEEMLQDFDLTCLKFPSKALLLFVAKLGTTLKGTKVPPQIYLF